MRIITDIDKEFHAGYIYGHSFEVKTLFSKLRWCFILKDDSTSLRIIL